MRGSPARGYWTYDFVLPGLLLHAFETGDAADWPPTWRVAASGR